MSQTRLLIFFFYTSWDHKIDWFIITFFLLHAKGCLASHISRDLAGMLLSFVAFVVRSYA